MAAFKRINPDLYNLRLSFAQQDARSKKDVERYWYYYYALNWYRKKDSSPPPNFFFNDKGQRTNKAIAIAIGQLLLTAWYFDGNEFGIDLANQVHEIYKKKQQQGGKINSHEFVKVCDHLRANFQYYLQHPDKANLTLIENLLPNDADQCDTYAFFIEIRTAQRNKGIDYWIEKYEDLECRYINLECRFNELTGNSSIDQPTDL